MRPGSVTHGFDNEQRSISLGPFSQVNNVLTVPAPDNTDQARYLAPSGYYLLFVVTGTGASQIPSLAPFVKLVDPNTSGFWATRR
jgi:hypothetical protein